MEDGQRMHEEARVSDGACVRVPSASRALTRRGFLAASALGLAAALAPSLPGCSTSKNVVVGTAGDEVVDMRLTFFGFKYEPLNVAEIGRAHVNSSHSGESRMPSSA